MSRHPIVFKGRGATLNPQGRFEKLGREDFDDGWTAPAAEEEASAPKTEVTPREAKTIISRNDSPDIPFSQSINPYWGCEHGCIYCMVGDTPILMADGRVRELASIRRGDEIYGTVREGWYRRYAKTQVLAHWSVVKPAYRITLEEGTCLTAGPDHRFLTDRGWKFVVGTEQGRDRRPHLTTGNKLMGCGAFAKPALVDDDYRKGYLCGLIRGDGHLAYHRYSRPGRAHGDQHHFRLAMCDDEALARAKSYLAHWAVSTQEFSFQEAVGNRPAMRAIRTQARFQVELIRSLVAWPDRSNLSWEAGFLAGIFDAEGSFSEGVLRISNTDGEIIARIASALRTARFNFAIEHVHREKTKPIDVVRIKGGLKEHFRFFHSTDPAISRKRDIARQAVKSAAALGIVSIERLPGAMRLYDISTGTEDFIANGVVSHNCYARPSYAYWGMSPGLDFETKLVAKTNAAKLLREELAHPRYRCEPITLGANTDCYQPVEREWRITRQVLEVLHECRHPVGIITKSSLVERDIDLLADMARDGLAEVWVSVTSLDGELARRLEPRAAAPHRRLQTIAALAAAGIPVGVMVAPVIPALNDKHIEAVLGAAHAAGARRAGMVMLRLPNELKELFKDWLHQHYPMRAGHVLSLVRQLHGAERGSDDDAKLNDPRFGHRMRGEGIFAELATQRFRKACGRLGLNRSERNAREVGHLVTGLFRPPAGPQMDLF
jgi:DNA repair photolyase